MTLEEVTEGTLVSAHWPPEHHPQGLPQTAPHRGGHGQSWVNQETALLSRHTRALLSEARNT